ncbi:CHAT domain-containing protein [Spirulina sp. CS-785/01]|uniref:CHAT domain-containing protein n=1 Tax=Spirulina sp. CS-785/01 TaxID=3021716 RepID=UPI00232DA554|nr:CHAT domain-containing protein [Spirulina sp. CS-785/01]MDB9314013.1 CHAT domain-containing protein [Spirulina sp. CS-785/01]
MRQNQRLLLAFLLTLWIAVVAPMGIQAQSGNQSDVTGPNPLEIVPRGESDGTPTSAVDNTSVQVDRSTYETQLQQASLSQAIQLQEEYQALQFCNYLKLTRCGQVPTLEQVVQLLSQIARTTETKAALIYVSSQGTQLETLTVFPTQATASGKSLTPAAIAAATQRVSMPRLSREEVVQVARQWRRTVTRQGQGRDQLLAPAQQLYDWIIAPIAEELARREIDVLVFSLDSGLRLLPLAAMHDGQQFLIEQYAVTTVPSFGLADLQYADIRQQSILAMGASQFANDKDLPGVELEIQTIAQPPWDSTVFLNEAFTVNNFLQASQQDSFGIIHLATHGVFQSGSLDNSYLEFSDRRVTLSQFGEMATQLQWTTQEGPFVELLVLSACRTAVGNEEAELGFAGLAVKLGIKSALASLWRVSDVGTVALMAEYYLQLTDTPIKAEALRQAQLKMLRGEVRMTGETIQLSNGEQLPLPSALQSRDEQFLAHPYFWASFVLIGNWN